MNLSSKRKASILSLLLLLIPLFFLGTSSAEATVTNEQKITLKKLIFDTLPAEQQNTGDQMTWTDSTPLAGAGFTAYDVTADYWTVYDQTSGTQTAKETAAVNAVKNLNVTGKTSFAFPITNTAGEATLNLPVVSGWKNAVYLFKETTTPAGAVAEKSVPFVLGLPVVNADGTNKSTVYLYPKNEYKTATLTFTKYGVPLTEAGEAGEAAPLAGAEFILKEQNGGYYRASTGKFDGTTANATRFTSGSNGVVSADNLILKAATYEFYEVDSSVATAAPQAANDPEKYHYAENPVVTAKVTRNPQTSVLGIAYDYYDKTLTSQTDQSSAQAYNYLVPNPKKTAEVSNVDIGQTVRFTLKQQIPLDIKQYTSFALVDTPNSQLALVSTEAEIFSSLKIDGAAVSGLTLTSDNTAGDLTIHFTPSQLAAYAGKELTLEIKMKVKPGAVLDTDITNEVVFTNNFKPKFDRASIKTYGKTFLKMDADTKKPLQGAQFVVKKGDLYMKDTAGDIIWVANQADATVLTSGSDGYIRVQGLAQKDPADQVINYQLIETAAPEGYVISTRAVDFVADDGKTTLEVVNKLSGSLPLTGGIGLPIFLATGIFMIGVSISYYGKRRKQTVNTK